MAGVQVQPSRAQLARRLAPLYVGIIVGPLNTSGAFNLVPVFSEDFGVTLALASLAITVYMVPFVISQVAAGAIAEFLGPPRALVVGFSIFAGACLLAAVAPTFPLFLAVRALQGIGGGLILPVGMAIAAGQAPPGKTGTVIGGLQSAFAMGIAIGPGVAGLFAEQLDWRGFYLFLAVIGFMAALLISVTYALRAPARATRGNPLRPLRQALALPGVRLLSLIGFLLLFAGAGSSVFLAVWLQGSGLTGPAGAGLLLSISGLVGIVMSPVAGYLGDRWGAARAAILGISVTAVGLAGLLLLPSSLVAYPFFLLLLGMGNASTITNLGALSLMRWPQLRQAVAGIFNAARFSGLAVAPLILAPVYENVSIRGVLALNLSLLVTGALILTQFGRVARERVP